MLAQSILKLGASFVVAVMVGLAIYSRRLGAKPLSQAIAIALAGYSILQILLTAFLWLNHIHFPLNLEAMELVRLQHVQRLISGAALYAEPTSNFVALAYNPLSYILSVPFAWILGTELSTLRFMAIVGIVGVEVMLFLAVHRATRSTWWGLMTVGLFAAAYAVMDAYLDTAHADSWLLLTLLLGCYLVDADQNLSHTGQHTGQQPSPIKPILGIVVLIAAFWIKQHGALFAIAGVIYLIWRRGLRTAWIPMVLVTTLGAGLYALMPDSVLGPRFHYFTLQVPRQWSELNVSAIVRLIQFIIKSYGVLAILSGIQFGLAMRSPRRIDIWTFMLPIAILSGAMAALDPGNNNNVFIPMGTWFILTGILGLKQLCDRYAVVNHWGLGVAALGLSFVLMLYNPLSVMVSPNAAATYQDFISYLKSLNGTVYSPWIGQLQDGYRFQPSVHWVPLEDMVRGPHTPDPQQTIVRTLLQPVSQPKGNAYLLLNDYPLSSQSMLSFLSDRYVFEQDTGERFKALSTLPRRINLNYPRYLYRYKGQTKDQAQDQTQGQIKDQTKNQPKDQKAAPAVKQTQR